MEGINLVLWSFLLGTQSVLQPGFASVRSEMLREEESNVYKSYSITAQIFWASWSYVKSMSSGPGKGSRGQLMKQLKKTRQAQLAQTSRMEMKEAPRS